MFFESHEKMRAENEKFFCTVLGGLHVFNIIWCPKKNFSFSARIDNDGYVCVCATSYQIAKLPCRIDYFLMTSSDVHNHFLWIGNFVKFFFPNTGRSFFDSYSCIIFSWFSAKSAFFDFGKIISSFWCISLGFWSNSSTLPDVAIISYRMRYHSAENSSMRCGISPPSFGARIVPFQIWSQNSFSFQI